MSEDAARFAAVEAFTRALMAGAEREDAFRVAVAKFRAVQPLASEARVRRLLSSAVAAERLGHTLPVSRRVH